MHNCLKSLSNDSLTRVSQCFVLILIIFWFVVRFVALEVSPEGFYFDETPGATHILCLQENGRDFYGKSWPLFSSNGIGNFTNGPYLYAGTVWTTVFGSSPTSLRAMSGFFVLLTILGIGFLAYRVGGASLGLGVLFTAALSPWAFQHSRIAWDPPLAPAFLVWGLCCLLLGKKYWSAFFAGLLFALSAYAYKPLVVHMLFLLLLLLVFRKRICALSIRR